jgi:hypothetical protein
MRYDIPEIKPTKTFNILFALLAFLGLAFSIYVFTHVAELSGIVTEQQVIINKDKNEAKVIFKVNDKEFIFKDTVTELIENESSTEYKLAKVNFNIGDTIKVNYKDAYDDRKPTYTSKNMKFKVTSMAQVPFKEIEEQAMDLVEQYIYLNLDKDSDGLKKLIHSDSKMDISYLEVPDNLDKNNIELDVINPKFKLIEDTYELTVRENIYTTTEMIQKNKSVYIFKFDGNVLKIDSVEIEPVTKK